jgi:hypothetical protein
MPATRYSADVYWAIVAVAIAPILIAVIGDRLQHLLPEVYWAVPVSLATFYTPTVWGLSLLKLAQRSRVRHWAISWGFVGALVLAAGRVVYWWPSQSERELGTLSHLIEDRVSNHAVGNWIVSLCGLTTYILLSVGTKHTLSAHRLKQRESFRLRSERDQRRLQPRVTPSVVCVGVDGWVAPESTLESERSTSAAAFHRRWWDGVRFFQRDGICYEVVAATTDQHLSPLSEILADAF